MIKSKGIDLEALRDGWGRPYYFRYEESSQFADRVVIENVSKPGEKPRETLSVTPVTRRIGTFRISSLGEKGTDFNNRSVPIASFGGILSEQTREDSKPKIVIPKTVFANGRSAIFGIVTDANEAAIPNAQILIVETVTGAEYLASSNTEGIYLRTGLPAGKYSVRFAVSGFKDTIVNEIELGSEQLMEMNVRLEAGTGGASYVTVTGGANLTVESTDTMMSTTITRTVVTAVPKTVSGGVLTLSGLGRGTGGFEAEYGGATGGVVRVVTKSGGGGPTRSEPVRATPRLREYFPETLLFVPELVTEKNGKVAIRYRLADNITTWKIYTVASDKQGRVGFAETSVKAFQPFFVDLDPPKFLTVGDEILLPTQVRNYTPQTQKVEVTMDRADWFAFIDPNKNRQTVDVPTNSTANAIFGFKANQAVTDGKQRVTAVAETDSDAIEKPITVRPDGEEIVRTESSLFNGSAAFDLDFPANAIAKTYKAELKIYPNLMAHVTESIDGLLQRPYGCGEQTVSSTYPNLMILKFNSGFGSSDLGMKTEKDPKSATTSPKSALVAKALKNLGRGYERLVGFQSADGGFSYWGTSDSDLALTAYALRFLTDAQAFVEVDESLIEKAREYLVKQQRADGSWTKIYSWEKGEDPRRTKMLTTYAARALAMTKPDSKPPTESLKKALAYLKTRNAEIDEPYTLALYGLAALDGGDTNAAREAAEKLVQLAKDEGQTVYWNLETNTPFYGWGTPGRIETTALVVQLLIRLNKLGTEDQKSKYEDQISKATMFLLKNKDRYGVWYSTQTTINVLDAFLAAMSKPSAQKLTVSVGGETLRTIDVPADQIEPFTIDLTGKIVPGSQIGVMGSADSEIMTQLVRSHYIPWKDSVSTNREVNNSRAIRLDYTCDTLTGKILDKVTCSVEAERIGFRGYGMLLAEIGVPPGADVSRESLDKALKDGISRYEVLPDRIIVYMWAQPGGTKFSFSFKPRYAINAQIPASFVYDYYNEEAKAVVAPMRFRFE